MVDPTVTGIVNEPSACGVPFAFRTIACAPVAEKVPDAMNVTPLTAVVTIEYVPAVVTSTFTVAVLEELVRTPQYMHPVSIRGCSYLVRPVKNIQLFLHCLQ